MDRFRLVTDLAECRDLWGRMIPPESIFDLWDVRACFQRQFRRPPCFIATDDGHSPAGLLPLSWIGESGRYGCFPGETWHGKTWIEQNRIVAGDAAKPWKARAAEVGAEDTQAGVAAAMEQEGPQVRVKIAAPQNREVAWQVAFE